MLVVELNQVNTGAIGKAICKEKSVVESGGIRPHTAKAFLKIRCEQ